MNNMADTIDNLPSAVTGEIRSIIEELLEKGWNVSSFRYDRKSFGNWYVDLARFRFEFRIVKDRSRYFVSGPSMNELRRVGLGRSFDDQEQFRRALVAWVADLPLE
jgi:hypothetical protein